MQSEIIIATFFVLLNYCECEVVNQRCCKYDQLVVFSNSSTPYCDSFPNYSDTTGVFNYETSKIDPVGLPNCTNRVVLHNLDDIWFRRGDHSSSVEIGLRWPYNKPLWLPLPQSSYCRDGIFQQQSSRDSGISGNVTLYDDGILVCKEDLHDYKLYLLYRYLVAGGDLFLTFTGIVIIIIYIILRKTQRLVGWLVFTLVVTFSMYFGASGTLTIVDADWLSVRSTTLCSIVYSIVRYLQFTVNTANLTCHFQMLLTFWKMTRRLKAADRSLSRLKFYVAFIFLFPLLITAISQIVARIDPDSSWVVQSRGYAHGRCRPPEMKVFEQAIAVITVLTLVTVVASGVIIIYLRFGAKINNNPPLKKQFTESSILFLKLFLGSGSPILIRSLAFLYVGDELNPLHWTFTFIFVSTQFFTALYFLFVFGLTSDNMKKVSLVLSGQPVHVITSMAFTASSQSTSKSEIQNLPRDSDSFSCPTNCFHHICSTAVEVGGIN